MYVADFQYCTDAVSYLSSIYGCVAQRSCQTIPWWTHDIVDRLMSCSMMPLSRVFPTHREMVVISFLLSVNSSCYARQSTLMLPQTLYQKRQVEQNDQNNYCNLATPSGIVKYAISRLHKTQDELKVGILPNFRISEFQTRLNTCHRLNTRHVSFCGEFAFMWMPKNQLMICQY